jgi:hypothetical protein
MAAGGKAWRHSISGGEGQFGIGLHMVAAVA